MKIRNLCSTLTSLTNLLYEKRAMLSDTRLPPHVTQLLAYDTSVLPRDEAKNNIFFLPVDFSDSGRKRPVFS